MKFTPWQVDNLISKKVSQICSKITALTKSDIIALDISVTFHEANIAYLFSNSSEEYQTLLSDFFAKEKHSLLFNKNKLNEDKGKYISEFKTYTNTKKVHASIVDFSDIKTTSTNFINWVTYLKNNFYKGHIIWLQKGFPSYVNKKAIKSGEHSVDYKISFFLILSVEIKPEVIKKIKDYLLEAALENEIFPLILDKQVKVQEQLQSHALQSAVAQVFARNFAHNIGSHVAIRATNRMAKERIANLYEWRNRDKKIYTDKINTPTVINWLDHMSEKLDLFEVARNEFLAEYNLPAKNVQFYRDVVLPFCENTLLMDNIAYSEGIHYQTNCSNRLKIVTKINGSEIKALYPHLKSHGICNKAIQYPDTFPYLVEPINESVTMEEAFNKKDLIDESGNVAEDIEICLTSEHTLYSILENLIRNSAKHNKDKLQEKELIIAIDIKDESDDYYCIQVSDNVSAVRPSQLKEFEKSLKTPLIRPDGDIEKKSLGIADMKINAHLLKTDTSITQQNLGDSIQLIYLVENGEVKPYTITTILDEKKEYNFGYQFKLCKPKKVIWIGKEDETKKYGAKGIVCCVDFQKFKPDNNHSKAEEQPLASYQFAILELDAVKDLTNDNTDPKRLYEWDDFLIKLPHRVLINYTREEFDKLTGKGYEAIKVLEKDGRIQLVNPEIPLPTESEMSKNKDWGFEFLKICWENWLRRWDISADNKGRLIIYFEDESVAETWNQFKIKTALIDIDFLSNQICDFSPISEGIKVAIYDHHASGYTNLVSKDKITKTPSEFIKYRSWIQFDKTSSDFIRFFYPSKDKNSNHLFLLEAFDAAMSRIVILDERIADLLTINNTNTKNIKREDGFNAAQDEIGDYADMANNGNVFFITHLQDNHILNNATVNFKLKFEQTPILELVPGRNIVLPNGPDASTSFSLDALIIHRTFLLELFKYKSNLEQKEIIHLLYKKFRRVVVVSGGGYPHSIVGFKVYFKTYSNLKSSFNLYPSKLSLNNLI